MRKMALILVILLLPAAGMADFSITFENTFDKKMTYMLYWIDNPFEKEKPFNMAGGELGALESRVINPMKAGSYMVVWEGEGKRTNELKMVINAGVTTVTVTPDKFVARH